ncbi:HNH endonuclease signature motif containing protein [Rhodococcus ruber]|uniref:HNH endonuclease n=1 Tax=Rhodococcus ruber TaxID=1830 RepID=A0A098BRD0_9NOCA|nr:HNH endonuclease signature motif containing protein [Rhodococcus ruber]MCD2130039.1 HNH endonuclease [Rhodococcus ruber]MCZ4506572.1 HNH endonuclease signature motif containing protein [Rhodococcus ruber]MCZ4533722.1 HNH endonuclease signature motif containing protein [Rhodococcus ruber]MCZ4623960.1 HNH endonuclease signature motif containing protein [Rhodococcus ruber]MDI9985437.1 HNH endonuclease signature motif containing protein [Rhodococcus ruber]
MIGATPPCADDNANYAHVAAHRKRKGETRPEILGPAVLALYKDYMSCLVAAGGPEPNGAFTESDQQILKGNADYLTLANFASLRGAILSAGPAKKCPYCYQLAASQVDHYLPKAHFGEYAIYAPNLVPICGRCNGKKLNRYKRPEGGRRYLHPYFDRLPTGSTPFVTATLSVGASITIAFNIVKVPGISDEIWNILRSQFADLDLGTRYMEEAIETMMSMRFSQ